MRSASDQQQIDELRAASDRLLDAGGSANTFLPAVLELSRKHPQIFAATIWLADDKGQVRLVADDRLGDFLRGDRLNIDPDHQQLLQQTLADGKSRVASDRRVPDAGLAPHSLLLAGLRLKERSLGVLELYAGESPGERTLQHLRQMAETLAVAVSRFFDREPATPAKSAAPTDTTFWNGFERFAFDLQRSLDLDEVSAIAVNDVRQLLGCDRASLTLKHGPRTIVRAISQQDEVQRRSNQVQALARLAERVMTGGEPVTYRGSLEGLPPAIEQPLADYLTESRMRMVRLVPLREPAAVPRDEDDSDAGTNHRPANILGCLVLEQAAESRPAPGLIERGDVLAEHVAAAVANAQRHEQIFLLPLWRRLGRTAAWFRGRRLWIAAAIVAGLVALGLLLAIIPWEYRVEATGQALPVVRHGVFAPYDATVKAVLVESNQRVTKGTPLLTLESAELDEEATRLGGEIARLEEESYKLRRDQDEARRIGNRESEQQFYTQYRQARSELAARQEQLEIIQAEQQKLAVLAPADGVVATFQIEQLLLDRPVQRGDLLLEVMDDRGDWRLELDVPEYRMGHLLAALQASESGTLAIDYVPATDARLDLDATLTEVATRSNESQDAGTIVQVFATIDPDQLPGRRIGADVDARIRCGKKSLFYCLFGDVVEFLQRKVWW
jgi:multidrug efflux pump subunit AcrA (membrane-fusion protein)